MWIKMNWLRTDFSGRFGKNIMNIKVSQMQEMSSAEYLTTSPGRSYDTFKSGLKRQDGLSFRK